MDYKDRFLQHQTVRFTLSLRQALKIVLKFFVTRYWVIDFSQVALIRAFVTVGYDVLSSCTEINTIFGALCTYKWSWPLQKSKLVSSVIFFFFYICKVKEELCANHPVSYSRFLISLNWNIRREVYHLIMQKSRSHRHDGPYVKLELKPVP